MFQVLRDAWNDPIHQWKSESLNSALCNSKAYSLKSQQKLFHAKHFWDLWHSVTSHWSSPQDAGGWTGSVTLPPPPPHMLLQDAVSQMCKGLGHRVIVTGEASPTPPPAGPFSKYRFHYRLPSFVPPKPSAPESTFLAACVQPKFLLEIACWLGPRTLEFDLGLSPSSAFPSRLVLDKPCDVETDFLPCTLGVIMKGDHGVCEKPSIAGCQQGRALLLLPFPPSSF